MKKVEMSIYEIENDNDGLLEQYIEENKQIIITEDNQNKAIIVSIEEYEKIHNEIEKYKNLINKS